MGDTNNSFDAKAKNTFMLSTDINVKGTVVGQIDIFTFLNAGISTAENIQEGASAEEFVADVVVDVGIDLLRTMISSAVAGAATGLVAGSVAPGIGNLIGIGAGFLAGLGYSLVTDVIKIEGVSLRDYMKKGIKDGLTYITDGVADIWDKACEWGSDLLCSTIG